MKVLFVTRKWPPAVGGMEIYSREIARELGGLCDLDVLSLPGTADGRPAGKAALARFLARALWRILRHGRRYDALLLGDVVLHPLAVAARVAAPSARVVGTAHGTDVAYDLRPGLKPRIYAAFLKFVGRTAGAADVMLANSRATAQHCRRIGFANVRTVPLGVRVGPDAPSDEPPEPYVLFVGRVDRRKGAGWFAREVLPGLPEGVGFKAVGTVWSESEARAVEAAGGELCGPAHGEALRRLRRRAIAVVVPNVRMGGRDFEGFGLTAIEAAADGGVLLASGIDGIVDAVRDGETGFLMPPEDPRAWRAKLAEVAAWRRERRSAFLAGARRAIETHYDWRRVAEAVLDAASGGADATRGTDGTTSNRGGER